MGELVGCNSAAYCTGCKILGLPLRRTACRITAVTVSPVDVFFTVNLLERSPNVLLVRHSDLLRQAVRRVKQVRPFCSYAFVDYIHYNPVKHG